MRVERRNDKEHQRLRRQAYYEAQQALFELHRILKHPTHPDSVGRRVAWAAQMGMIRPGLVWAR